MMLHMTRLKSGLLSKGKQATSCNSSHLPHLPLNTFHHSLKLLSHILLASLSDLNLFHKQSQIITEKKFKNQLYPRVS